MTALDPADARPRPLKILRVIARLNIGGPARHVVLLNQELDALGHDTLLVHGAVGPGEASFEGLADSEGIRRLKLEELGPSVNVLRDVRALFALTRIIFRESPDVIHSHTAKAGALARLGGAVYNASRSRRRRALLVHTFHGHVLEGYFGGLGNAAVRVAERSLAMLSDCLVAISPSQRRDLVERFRIAPPDLVAVIPLGLDLKPFIELPPADPFVRVRLGLSPADSVIGCVGRFVRIKDLGTLVRAFALVVQSLPNARLLLVGDGPLRGEIATLAGELGVHDRVHFVGWTEDLAPLYAAMDVCALSSLNEGTPVALIEAMASGKPVVTTSVGGVPDVVEQGRTGILVPARRPDALAEAIVALIRDRDKARLMGLAAREDVSGRFSRERLGADMNRLYARCLERKRGTISTAL